MEHKRVSQLTGITHFRDIPVTQAEVKDWQVSGQYIQNYFPDLSADDREFLLTGITPEEWDYYMGEAEEEDDSLNYEEFDEMFASGESVDIFVERRDDS